MKKEMTALCIAILLLTGCAARPDAAASIAEAPQSNVEAGAETAQAVNTLDVAAFAKQEEAEADNEAEVQNESCETDSSPAAAKPEAEQSPATQPMTEIVPAQPAEITPAQQSGPSSDPQTPSTPTQVDTQLTPEPAAAPEPQPPARPAFDAGTVVGMACAQIGGMTRVNGAEQGMGSFTHAFSVNETQESIAAGLASIMAQERDLYGNTYYDIVYCGESGGYHTFRCYRA